MVHHALRHEAIVTYIAPRFLPVLEEGHGRPQNGSFGIQRSTRLTIPGERWFALFRLRRGLRCGHFKYFAVAFLGRWLLQQRQFEAGIHGGQPQVAASLGHGLTRNVRPPIGHAPERPIGRGRRPYHLVAADRCVAPLERRHRFVRVQEVPVRVRVFQVARLVGRRNAGSLLPPYGSATYPVKPNGLVGRGRNHVTSSLGLGFVCVCVCVCVCVELESTDDWGSSVIWITLPLGQPQDDKTR